MLKKILSAFLMIFLISCGGKNSGDKPSPVLKPRKKTPFLLNQLKAIDENKPTMCSITVNSTDERELFQENLNDDFNFIELVEEENDFWFEDSCDSQLKCDVVVVSGHFGGSFFGKSKQKLSLKKMEQYACEATCDGILKHPKEAYLFGCNTTAGKDNDGRTAEEYANLLYNDYPEVYTSREMAELHAAFRYSPIGSETQQKMKRVFSSARIYGFHSKAPLGSQIRPRLERYFDKVGGYLDHFLTMDISVENSAWRESMSGQAIKTVVGSSEIESPMCVLSGPNSNIEKLRWVSNVLEEEINILAYSPEITDFFNHLEESLGRSVSNWPAAERGVLNTFNRYTGAKNRVTEFLSAPVDGILSTQLEILKLGELFGWYTQDDAFNIKRNFIVDLFKNNLTIPQSHQICKMGVEVSLTASELPQRGHLNTQSFNALKCLGVSDSGVLMRMLEVVTDTRNNQTFLKRRIIDYVASVASGNEEVQRVLFKLLNSEDTILKNASLEALSKMNVTDDEILNRMSLM